MAQALQVYKCETCGLMVQVMHEGVDPVCCGEPMVLMEENTVDAAKEKHVPVIEKGDGKVTVKVGSVPHPMEPEHYIEWIQIKTDGKVMTQFLEPGQKPEAVFEVEADTITALESCNLHGLWKA